MWSDYETNFIIGLFLLVGCGQRLDHIDSNKLPPKGGIEPTAMEYVTSFEDDYGTTVQVSVELKERLKKLLLWAIWMQCIY